MDRRAYVRGSPTRDAIGGTTGRLAVRLPPGARARTVDFAAIRSRLRNAHATRNRADRRRTRRRGPAIDTRSDNMYLAEGDAAPRLAPRDASDVPRGRRRAGRPAPLRPRELTTVRICGYGKIWQSWLAPLRIHRFVRCALDHPASLPPPRAGGSACAASIRLRERARTQHRRRAARARGRRRRRPRVRRRRAR